MSYITFVVSGPPRGKARHRMTRSGRGYNPKSNEDEEKRIAAEYRREANGLSPHTGGVIVDIIAMYVPPRSWSKKKRANPGPKVTKPDCDNIGKLCLDALNKVAWLDDSQVLDVRMRKRYGDHDALIVMVKRVREFPE